MNCDRRRFLKNTIGASGAVTMASCSWKYRGIHEQSALQERGDGFLMAVSEIKKGRAYLFGTQKGIPIVVLWAGDEIKAYESICPHALCEINDGEHIQPVDLENGELRCFLHDSYFDINTGKRIRGPAGKGSELPLYPIEIKEGGVFVKKA